jgi:hypothetical protein
VNKAILICLLVFTVTFLVLGLICVREAFSILPKEFSNLNVAFTSLMSSAMLLLLAVIFLLLVGVTIIAIAELRN